MQTIRGRLNSRSRDEGDGDREAQTQTQPEGEEPAGKRCWRGERELYNVARQRHTAILAAKLSTY